MDRSTSAGVRFLDRPGGRLAYSVRGEGPLVVCAPGVGDLGRRGFTALADRLVAAGHRVAVADPRGHGRSSADWPSHTESDVAGDLLALARHLGADRVTLVGSSFGGSAAVVAAATDPGLVRGLVLLGAFVRDQPRTPLDRAGTLLLSAPWLGRRVWTAFWGSLFGPRPPLDPGRVSKAAVRDSRAGAAPDGTGWRHRYNTGTGTSTPHRQEPPRSRLSSNGLPKHDLAERKRELAACLAEPGRMAALRAMLGSDHTAALAAVGQVRCPAVVVMGELDRDFADPAAEARFTADALGGAPTVLAPGAGHYPHATHPDLVAGAVLNVLDRARRPACRD
ncbi:alpha/beta fold hydrolase [Actinokineospora pegani]|uniref:alpha/beta fold hydrolase n=1 Tax=Actinokineospora pegani TaxID=2654637 RepID=UPI0012EAE48F|nr:alpha/beta hydrolase [Actinokineospora pegani]